MIDTVGYCTLHFDTCLTGLDLDSMSQVTGVWKSKNLFVNDLTQFSIDLDGIRCTVENPTYLFYILYVTSKLNISFDDLYLHLRSHFYEKSKTLVYIFLQISPLDEIQYGATTSWFVEAHARFTLCKKYSRERTVLMWFYERCVLWTCLCLWTREHVCVCGHLRTDLFQTWYDAKQ